MAAYYAIGLMSGTSLDGVDAALVRTDGVTGAECLSFFFQPYDDSLREKLRSCLGLRTDPDGRVREVERLLTLAHAQAVRTLVEKSPLSCEAIRVVGFHGHTLFHDPDNGFTWQIGDGALLAEETGIPVVNDFRSADVSAGGQGAPLLPLYHRIRLSSVSGLKFPVVVLNIGGVSNITWIGPREEEIAAFDTGPGNALIDDFIRLRTEKAFDEGGRIAQSGHVHQDLLDRWLSHSYFKRTPPKSLDRDAWDVSEVDSLSLEDGAATLTAFTIHAIARSLGTLVPAPPLRILVSGGGRKNGAIMTGLAEALNVPVGPVEEIGWNGDSLEAEGFACFALRKMKGLPISFPQTTGVKTPVKGGCLHLPSRSKHPDLSEFQETRGLLR